MGLVQVAAALAAMAEASGEHKDLRWSLELVQLAHPAFVCTVSLVVRTVVAGNAVGKCCCTCNLW
jgi:hypothetical protein